MSYRGARKQIDSWNALSRARRTDFRSFSCKKRTQPMWRTLIAAGLVWLAPFCLWCSHVTGQAQPNPAIQAAIPELMKREVSREGKDYLERLRKNTPFGAKDFNLQALRAGMG